MTFTLLRTDTGSIRTATFDESRKLAAERGTPLASGKRFLAKGNQSLPPERFWTKTWAAYPAKDCKMGTSIEFSNGNGKHLLDTAKFEGMENVVLIIDDYTLVRRGCYSLIKPSEISILFDFPQTSQPLGGFGWNGMKLDLKLHRNDEATVAPVVIKPDPKGKHTVWMSHGMSERFGILVEGKLS